MRLLIIGYGNPLRGDDAFGFLAAERLKSLIDDSEVQVLAVQQLTPELADPIGHAKQVIFIDAAVPGAAETGSGSAFTHHVNPATLLAGAHALYGGAAEPLILTVPGENFDFGAPLSPSVAAALDQTVEKVLSIAAAKQAGGAP